jgi:HYR domain-containing protein
MAVSLATVLALLSMAVGRIALAAPSAPLNLQGSLAMASRDAVCPDGLPLTTACHSRTAQGGIPGLGRVSHTYMYNGDFTRCGPGDVVIVGYTTSLRVVGKGEISVSVADAPCLLADLPALNATGSFTVTGGTGNYAGASGSGRIERAASFAPGGASGTDTWIGTLVVPGLEFDLTPPVISGAATTTVKARRGARNSRVTYHVTAQDDRDGTVPVACAPKSGSRFSIGRTKVNCDAVDTSANSSSASFTITVKKGR